jgi:hypothetical protein
VLAYRSSWLFLSLLTAAGLLLAACSPASTPSSGESPLATPTAGEPTPVTAEPAPTAAEPAPPAEVELVRQDLAQRLNIPLDQVGVLSVKAVDWPDSSLGCPRPNVLYAQVITPGYEIVLDVSGQQYSYHTGGGTFVLCENGLPVDAPTATTTPPGAELGSEAAALVEKAKQDLSSRVGVSPADIVVESVESVQWRDSSLGCPQPGMNYLTVITPGYLIKLRAQGQIYEYHASLTNVVWCKNPQPPYSVEPNS